MFTKQIVLVAGFDYELTPSGREGGAGFAARCQRRMDRLIKRFPKEKLKITIFDVSAGTVRTSEIDDVSKKRQWTTPTKNDSSGKIVPMSFNPVSGANNYDPKDKRRERAFVRNPRGVMSIEDVYQFIIEIGDGKEAGTLIELSLFSHGWVGGPILVNSRDELGDPDARDPDDKDARFRKDFNTTNIGTIEMSLFKKAFAANGIVWVWGCSFAYAFRTLFATLFATNKYKTTSPGKLKDTDIIPLDFTEDTSVESGPIAFDGLLSLLPGGTQSMRGKSRRYKVTVTFQLLKERIRDFLKTGIYATAVAKAAGVNTIAALVGTYADYEKNGDKLMLIPRSAPPYDDDFRREMFFYTMYLGMTLDPENRGYCVYLP